MPTQAEKDRIWSEALAQARAEHDAEIEDQIKARAHRIRSDQLAELRRVERNAAEAKRREAEERELAKGALKAWRQKFGRRLAGQLGLRTPYHLLRDRGEAWAFTDQTTQRAAAELVETFDREARIVADSHPVEGIALVKAIGSDRLVALDPPIEVFEQRVREADAKRHETLKAKAKADDDRRRKRREVATFGVELDDAEEV
jgi:hypothetical protein